MERPRVSHTIDHHQLPTMSGWRGLKPKIGLRRPRPRDHAVLCFELQYCDWARTFRRASGWQLPHPKLARPWQVSQALAAFGAPRGAINAQMILSFFWLCIASLAGGDSGRRGWTPWQGYGGAAAVTRSQTQARRGARATATRPSHPGVAAVAGTGRVLRRCLGGRRGHRLGLGLGLGLGLAF